MRKNSRIVPADHTSIAEKNLSKHRIARDDASRLTTTLITALEQHFRCTKTASSCPVRFGVWSAETIIRDNSTYKTRKTYLVSFVGHPTSSDFPVARLFDSFNKCLTDSRSWSRRGMCCPCGFSRDGGVWRHLLTAVAGSMR